MADKKILILGGYGETGRRLSDHLIKRNGVDVLIVGRNESRALEFAAEMNEKYPGNHATGIACDIVKADSLQNLMNGVDFFIQAGPALPVDVIHKLAQAVLDAGADWMDVQLDPKQAAVLEKYDSRMKKEGRCFATQGGFHPGLPAAFVRWAASRVDKITDAFVGGFINPEEGLILTSGVDELIDLFSDYNPKVYKNGGWIETGLKMSEMRKFNFGFGIGEQTMTPMSLDEMIPLPEMFPSLNNTGFYVGGFDWVTNWITTPLMMVGIKLFPKVKANTWGRLMCWSHKTFNRPPYGTCLKLEAEGIKVGKKAKVELSLIHSDEYELTAIPMVSVIEQMLNGSAHKPGLIRMALLTDPEKILLDMQEMGCKIEENIF